MNTNSKLVNGMFATLLTLLFITILDVFVIVYLRLPSTFLGSTLPLWWWIPLGFIQFFLPLAVSLFLDNKLPLLNYLFFILGIEDTLFHLIVSKRIPDVYLGIYYLGVFWCPPKHIVLIGNLVAIGLAVILVYRFKRNF